MRHLVATYYNLNQTYIWHALFIGIIAVIILFWLITMILSKQDAQTCNNPVAQFFNKQLKQKCMAQQWKNDMSWFANQMQDKFLMLHETQDYLNSRLDDVIGKYTAENTADFQTAISDLQQRKEEVDALRQKALETHQLVVENKSGLQQLWNTWQQRLIEIKDQIRASLFAKRDKANTYVETLNRIQHNKKAAKKRKTLVKKYDKTKKYLENIEKLPDYAGLDLSVNDLSIDARKGRKN